MKLKMKNINTTNVAQVKDLSMILNSKLTFKLHIEYIAQKPFQIWGFYLGTFIYHCGHTSCVTHILFDCNFTAQLSNYIKHIMFPCALYEN